MCIIPDTPLLGKISRTRRLKSAHARNSYKSKFSDKKKLIRDSDTSSTDAVDSCVIKLQCPSELEVSSISPTITTPAYVNPALEMNDENL